MDKLFNDIGIAAWIHNTAPLARLTFVDFITPVEMLTLSSNTNGKYNVDNQPAIPIVPTTYPRRIYSAKDDSREIIEIDIVARTGIVHGASNFNNVRKSYSFIQYE